MKKSQRLILWGAVLLALLAAANGWYYHNSRTDQPDRSEPESVADSNSASATAKVASDVTASPLTYAQAVTIFAKERVEFNGRCEMAPNPLLVANGTTLMFDNRSRDALTFKLDGTGYTIPGYGFKLLRLESTQLPHVVKVECGGVRDTGEITLR